MTKTSEKITARKPNIRKPLAEARFDARLSHDQKKILEEAARIRGFKSLSEFVIQTTLEAAKDIIEQQRAILVSELDHKIFFDALVNPPKPNKELLQAAKSYMKALAAK